MPAAKLCSAQASPHSGWSVVTLLETACTRCTCAAVQSSASMQDIFLELSPAGPQLLQPHHHLLTSGRPHISHDQVQTGRVTVTHCPMSDSTALTRSSKPPGLIHPLCESPANSCKRPSQLANQLRDSFAPTKAAPAPAHTSASYSYAYNQPLISHAAIKHDDAHDRPAAVCSTAVLARQRRSLPLGQAQPSQRCGQRGRVAMDGFARARLPLG